MLTGDNSDDYLKLDIASEWISKSLGLRREDINSLAQKDNTINRLRAMIRDERSAKRSSVCRQQITDESVSMHVVMRIQFEQPPPRVSHNHLDDFGPLMFVIIFNFA